MANEPAALAQPWHFTRAALRSTPSLAALRQMLCPTDDSRRMAAAHRLVWMLFAGTEDDPLSEQTRDFLWREIRPGEFWLVSRRAPVDAHRIFDLQAPRPYDPRLARGDRLRFSLRANATRSVARDAAGRMQRADVVMAALHRLEPQARAGARATAIRDEGFQWLRRRGERGGFDVRIDDVSVDGYQQLVIPRGDAPGGSSAGVADMQISTLEFAGVLTVTDPSALRETLLHGLGRGKAFGCGLMLVRRAT